MSEKLTEELIAKYGDKYRILITDALRFLEEREPKWGMKTPISRRGYISALIKRAQRGD